MMLQKFVYETTGVKEITFKRIGGGYYADVYRFDYPENVSKIVKVYKTNGVMEKEIIQLKTLSEYSLVEMPQILYTRKADEKFSYDFVIMNFLNGLNGGNVFYFSRRKRIKIANQVVDNLLAFHNVHNEKGFGEIDGDIFYATFNEYYKLRSIAILQKAKQLKLLGELSDFVYEVMQEATKNFDLIFCLPITESSLIHGDYNMFNIMIDKKNCNVSAIIDPCGCMWADNEYDLYQLNNANGKYYNLLEIYASKKKLSENFRQKMAFYELFTEVEHYYNSGQKVQKKLITKQAKALKSYFNYLK